MFYRPAPERLRPALAAYLFRGPNNWLCSFGLAWLVCGMAAAQQVPQFFAVTKYGALGDGTTLNSAAINKAIDAASAAGVGTKQQAALAPPEAENVYPEPRMFGEIPACGFFVRHVKDLQM